jgi:hypothetical protein
MNVIQKGLFVLFFSLLHFQNLYGGSKYFTWIDPQSASRTRIDIASGEVFKEISLGEWQLYFKRKLLHSMRSHYLLRFLIIISFLQIIQPYSLPWTGLARFTN